LQSEGNAGRAKLDLSSDAMASTFAPLEPLLQLTPVPDTLGMLHADPSPAGNYWWIVAANISDNAIASSARKFFIRMF
jgi:hypothetical protein